MKRILSIIILWLMFGINLFPIVAMYKQEIIMKTIMLSDIAYEIDVKETKTIVYFEPTTPNPYELALKNMQLELEEISSIIDKKEWFIAYKKIMFKYIEWIDPQETVFDCFSEEEIKLICKMAETECYQQDFDSKCNVIAVAFNRLYSGDFGDTMTEVITTKNQFAYGRDNITEDTLLAVQYVFESNYTAQGALYFHSNNKTQKFCGNEWIFTDSAGHHFY